MRRITAALSAAAVVIAMAGLAAQAKPSFAGKWTMDPASAPAHRPAAVVAAARGGGRGGGLGQEMTITQDATTLTIEYMGGGQAPAPIKLVYKLDGTESKNTVMARGASTEQVSKAMWAGNNIVVATSMGGGELKRTFALEGGNLVVTTEAPGREGGAPTSTKVTYKKAG